MAQIKGINGSFPLFVHVYACSIVSDSLQPHSQASLSMKSSRQEYWSGLSFHTLVDCPNPGFNLPSLVSTALAGRFFTASITWEGF